MSDQLRAGIIGAGFIGGVHARAIVAAGGAVACVTDATPESSVEGATRLRARRSASSPEELIASDDVDVVHICTPNAFHADLARTVLASGKPVICEKPLATSSHDARDLCQRVREAGVPAAVPFVYRFYPSVREARSRIASGQTGALRVLHGAYLQDWLSTPSDTNWRLDPRLGGTSRAFGDIGVHWCDLMEFATGHRIVRLAALTAAVIERPGHTATEPTEDSASIIFETDRHATGSLVVSQVSPGRKNQLLFSFDGSDESLAFDQENPNQLWIGMRQENRILARGCEPSDGAAGYSILPPGHPQGYLECFAAFVADFYAVVAGEPRDGLPTFDDGLRAAILTESVLASAASREWMEVPT